MRRVVHCRVGEELAQRGWSWRELGRRAGLPSHVVGRLRRHRVNPALAVAERIAAALDLPIERLWELPS